MMYIHIYIYMIPDSNHKNSLVTKNHLNIWGSSIGVNILLEAVLLGQHRKELSDQFGCTSVAVIHQLTSISSWKRVIEIMEIW